MQQLKPANVFWNETSKTLKNLDFDDIYFQTESGQEESQYVFLKGNNLPQRFKTARNFRIGELGFGSGLNFLLTWKLWLETAPKNAQLHYFSIERTPLPIQAAKNILGVWPELSPLATALLDRFPRFFAGIHTIALRPGNVTLTLFLGEAFDALTSLQSKMDAWYLDGFAPAKNPDIWQDRLFPLIAQNTAQNGSFATFTAAGAVKRGMESAEFSVTKTKGFGKKRDMLTGSFKNDVPTSPITKTALVLGAGIAGCATAHALAQRGIDVTLIDKNKKIALETSGNPVGIIYPKLTAASSPAGDIHLHSFLFTRRLLDALPQAGFVPCGSLHLATTGDENSRQKKIAALADDASFARLLDADGASSLAGIKLDLPALYFKEAGCLRPPDFCQSLITACSQKIKTIFNAKITRLQKTGENWQALDETGRIIGEAPVAVIANGTGFQTFLPSLPLEFLKGQVTFLSQTPENRTLKTVICHDGYVTPVMNGISYAGATFDKVKAADDFSVSDEAHGRNLEKLAENISALKYNGAAVGGKTGYRVAAFDRLPLAGKIPGQNGLYGLLALGSHGMTTAPLLGELIACQITGDPLPLEERLIRHVSFDKIKTSDVLDV